MNYELIEARESVLQSLLMINDVQNGHASLYLTMIFAYVVVAFMAGAKLSRLQLGLTTFIFVLASAFEIFNIALLNTSIFVKMSQLAEFGGPIPDSPIGTSSWPALLVWSSGAVAALIFMWSVRRDKSIRPQ